MLRGKNLDLSLFIAIKMKQYSAIESCLQSGAKLTYKDERNEDAFHQAVRQNDTKAIKLLLDAKLKPDCRSNDNFHLTPIALAAYLQHWDCVKVIAQHKLENKNDKYLFGYALLYAVHFNRLEEAEMVINSADLSLSFKETGDYMLHRAVRNNNAAMVNLLLHNKADLTVKNTAGLTPIALAEQLDRVSLFQISEVDIYLANVDSFLKSYDPTTLKRFFTTFPSYDSLGFFNSIKAIYESNTPAQERKEKIVEKIRAHVAIKANKEVSRSIDKLKQFNLYDTTFDNNDSAKEVIVSSSWNIKIG